MPKSQLSLSFEPNPPSTDAFHAFRLIDRWLYRYEHYQARITIETRTYEPIEEMANMMHTAVRLRHSYDTKLKKRMVSYRASAFGSRAVRITYLIEPHLRIQEKARRATEILTIYREKRSIKTG